MIGTGKYDFPGIRKAGSKALNAVIATTSWGGTLIASPFKPVLDKFTEFVSEWLTNRGLLIIDVTAIYLEGEIDQHLFDKALDDALEKVKVPGLSDKEKRAIDDEVIKAFRRFGRVGNS